jgi:hypothetical protein
MVTRAAVYSEIEQSNPRRPDLHPLGTRALVESGALMLCIPQHVANGRVVQVPYVGPLRVAAAGRFCYVGALVLNPHALAKGLAGYRGTS